MAPRGPRPHRAVPSAVPGAVRTTRPPSSPSRAGSPPARVPGITGSSPGRTDPAAIDVPHRRITSGWLAGRSARDLGGHDAAVIRVRAQARVVIEDLQGKFPATSRSTAAQPSPGTASACQHVTSDRKIPIVVELPRFGAVVTIAATLCALASDCASTGHVWITVWRRDGLNPVRIFSLPIESMASGLVTGAWPPGSPGMSPGIAPPSGHIAQFIHKPYTQPPTLMTSPGWRDTARSPWCRR